MATIKSYTDISQSKKLAEILPLESADMHYLSGVVRLGKPYSKTHIPCWSLAALLGVLPESYQLTSNKEGKVQLMLIHQLEKDYYDNPVDACYEMIIRLSKNGLI